jgi:hypothetical protein
MKRTLLAVAVGVLASLLYLPYGGMHHGVAFNPGHDRFWSVPIDLIAVTPLILQTVFLGVAAALVVNLLPRKTKKRCTLTKSDHAQIIAVFRSAVV